MRLLAIHYIIGRDREIAPGQEFSANQQLADYLLQRGAASVVEEPAAEPEEATVAEKLEPKSPRK
ncbi:MAG: hypothetical protein QM757_26695 [Paludibaculum sp.]